MLEIQKLPEDQADLHFYSKGGNGYNDSIKIAYEYDSNGDPGYTDSYIGIQYLGSEPKLSDKIFMDGDSVSSVSFVSWTHNGSDPSYFTPLDDLQRFNKMRGYFDLGNSQRWKDPINPTTFKVPSNRSMLVS